MTAREDFRAAVREAERSGCLFTEGQFRAIFRAGNAYAAAAAGEALMSLGDELDAMAREWAEAGLGAPACGLGDAANLARERAHGNAESAADPSAPLGDGQEPASVLSDPGAADDCLEAGP